MDKKLRKREIFEVSVHLLQAAPATSFSVPTTKTVSTWRGAATARQTAVMPVTKSQTCVVSTAPLIKIQDVSLSRQNLCLCALRK